MCTVSLVLRKGPCSELVGRKHTRLGCVGVESALHTPEGHARASLALEVLSLAGCAEGRVHGDADWNLKLPKQRLRSQRGDHRFRTKPRVARVGNEARATGGWFSLAVHMALSY